MEQSRAIRYRPQQVSHFEIESAVDATGVCADIRCFGWNEPTVLSFREDVYYLDYSWEPRSPSLRPNTSLRPIEQSLSGGTVGDVVFFPPGTELDWESNTSVDFRLFCLTFDIDTIQRLFDASPYRGSLAPCFDVRSPQVKHALIKLAREVRSPGFAADIYVQSAALNIIVELFRYLHRENIRVSGWARGGMPGWRIRKLKDRINDGLSSAIELTDLSAECGIGVRHLCRTFRAETGISLVDYIAQQRLDLAMQLLRLTNMPVAAVAARTGFQTASGFSTSFLKSVGLTPRQYRNGAG
jgi:AraC family transcriptional regulator